MLRKGNDTLLVSFQMTENVDDCLLIIGRKEHGKDIYIVNAIQGPRAKDIYNSLIAQRKEES